VQGEKMKKVSKYLSFILRHKPHAIGLKLDKEGWASIDEIIEKTTAHQLTRDLIDIIVETNDKKRFIIKGDKIRANQGHSIKVDLALEPIEPPEYLLHGTATRFMDSIKQKGLIKGNRHHVHLSESEAVAKDVGSRYGKVVLLKIRALELYNKGYKFYRTDNNVWLVDSVPYEYIEIVDVEISDVCYKCAFFDKSLDIRQQYRCHTHTCPDNILDRKVIDALVKENNGGIE
jgi:putative RNA 2'-phosphotransferase